MPVVCFSCGKETQTDKVGRRDECINCGADLHVCKNCAHYDAKVYNECREPQADRVVEKERSNYCDFFLAKASGPDLATSADKLKAAAEALFKKKI